MRFLELLRIFRTIANLPNFADKASTRQWLLNLCDIAGLLTERTPTPADDAVLAFLKRSIADEKLFDPIFELLTALLDRDDAPTAAEAFGATSPSEIATEAKAAGVDPLTIVAIIEAIAALIKLIRERRGK